MRKLRMSKNVVFNVFEPIDAVFSNYSVLAGKNVLVIGGDTDIGHDVSVKLVEFGSYVTVIYQNHNKFSNIWDEDHSSTQSLKLLHKKILYNEPIKPQLIRRYEELDIVDLLVWCEPQLYRPIICLNDFLSFSEKDYEMMIANNIKYFYYTLLIISSIMKNNKSNSHMIAIFDHIETVTQESQYNIGSTSQLGLLKGLARDFAVNGTILNGIGIDSYTTNEISQQLKDVINTITFLCSNCCNQIIGELFLL